MGRSETSLDATSEIVALFAHLPVAVVFADGTSTTFGARGLLATVYADFITTAVFTRAFLSTVLTDGYAAAGDARIPPTAMGAGYSHTRLAKAFYRHWHAYGAHGHRHNCIKREYEGYTRGLIYGMDESD